MNVRVDWWRSLPKEVRLMILQQVARANKKRWAATQRDKNTYKVSVPEGEQNDN